MALTLTLTNTSVGPATADNTINVQCAVANTTGGDLSVTDLQIHETGSNFGVTVTQPYFLTPNVAPGTGNPTVANNGTGYFLAQVNSPAPSSPGESPNAPNSLILTDIPTGVLTLTGTVIMSDGTTATATLQVPMRTTITPFPVPLGGVMAFNGPSNAVNWFFFA